MLDEEKLNHFLSAQAAAFRVARGSVGDLRYTLARYISSGLCLGLSQGELIDFLGVSSPSILEVAGFSEHEEIQAMEVLGLLTDEDIRRLAH